MQDGHRKTQGTVSRIPRKMRLISSSLASDFCKNLKIFHLFIPYSKMKANFYFLEYMFFFHMYNMSRVLLHSSKQNNRHLILFLIAQKPCKERGILLQSGANCKLFALL